MIQLNKVYNENCTDTMKRMNDEFVDLVITSPPYDNRRQYENVHKFTFDEFKIIAKQLYRVVKKGGIVVWVVADETKNFCESLTSLKQAIYFVDNCGFNLLDTMIYKKIGQLPYSIKFKKYQSVFEYMFIFCKGSPKTFNPIMIKTTESVTGKIKKLTVRTVKGELKEKICIRKSFKCKGNIWEYHTGNENDHDRLESDNLHPAIFPKQLVIDHMKSWSNEGDVVFDSFAGSGTTLKVAEMMNRKWIGSEIVPLYCKLINKTLKRFDQRKKGSELWDLK